MSLNGNSKMSPTEAANGGGTPTHMFSRKFCEIFKNTHYVELLRTAASEQKNVDYLQSSVTKWSIHFFVSVFVGSPVKY